MRKTALITGVSGQDGAYLSQLLLKKDYEVIGIVRSNNAKSLEKLNYLGIKNAVTVEEIDLTDLTAILRLIQDFRPTEIYNLAAQSSVGLSFDQPLGTFSFNTASVINLLEAIRFADTSVKLYQASSSEMYGAVKNLPVNEESPMHPVSPYAVSKAAAHWMAINYRESYGLFVGTGILFNHESVLRADNFFVKKVIDSAMEITRGERSELRLGNIDIKRDFGYAPAYVEAMWRIMHVEEPGDFVICSGKSLSLREIVFYIFDKLDIDRKLITSDPKLFRPNEIEDIYGDPSKAKAVLGWEFDLPFFEILDILIEEHL